MKTRSGFLPAALFAMVFLPFGQDVRADAIVRSQAMFADTIAEIYAEEDAVIVDLEIGLGDLPAFRNLMPDAIYAEMGYEPEPLADRLARFFHDDLLVLPDAGDPLSGGIAAIGPETRVQRDPITGEPIAAEDGEEETVVRARLVYALKEQPASLTLGLGGQTAGANVGFVFYHKAVAVNDFRYLSPAQTVTLDWEDPWYSAFETRALRRQNFAPMSGFIYVEPYEVRKEIIARPKDLQDWVDLGLEGRDTIPIEIQEELKRRVGEFLRERHAVVIDGEVVEPELARINFLERTLNTSRVIDPPQDLDIDAAILGAIFVYPTVEPLPQSVTMDWDTFNDRIALVPASTVDQAGPLPTYLEPDFAVLEWKNFLKNPQLPSLQAILPPPNALENANLYLRWLLSAALLWAIWRMSYRLRTGTGIGEAAMLTALLAVVTAGSFWFARIATLTDERSTEIVAGLLHNVYRAFDFRQDEQIYDVLEKSVDGDLLAQIYLETRRGLELEKQGGARAKVKDIEMIDLATRASNDGGFIAAATWNVAGSVGHWGHVHERRNQYQAELTIRAVDDAWKLVDLEILTERRL
ncbi:MAG: hypothetical protein ACR2QV_04010 [Gammaproteobacteria bacterium]